MSTEYSLDVRFVVGDCRDPAGVCPDGLRDSEPASQVSTSWKKLRFPDGRLPKGLESPSCRFDCGVGGAGKSSFLRGVDGSSLFFLGVDGNSLFFLGVEGNSVFFLGVGGLSQRLEGVSGALCLAESSALRPESLRLDGESR
jgi:hypothetical protein